MEQNFTIKNITKNSTNLEVDWSDGKKSKFNYLWLRDNCPTAHDKDSVSYTHMTLPTIYSV